MERFTVELQPGMYFPAIWTIVGILAALLAAAAWYFARKYVKFASEMDTAPVKELSGVKCSRLVMIKDDYRRKIRESRKAVESGVLSPREGTQDISRILREFVHECTGRDVRKYNLRELRKANVKELPALVGLLYKPEFASEDAASETVFGLYDEAEEMINGWIE